MTEAAPDYVPLTPAQLALMETMRVKLKTVGRETGWLLALYGVRRVGLLTDAQAREAKERLEKMR